MLRELTGDLILGLGTCINAADPVYLRFQGHVDTGDEACY